MNPKSIFASKTFWIGGALAGYGAFLTYLEGFTTDPTVMLVTGVLTVINRYFTTRPIK